VAHIQYTNLLNKKKIFFLCGTNCVYHIGEEKISMIILKFHIARYCLIVDNSSVIDVDSNSGATGGFG
jgi:hypothetical protein